MSEPQRLYAGPCIVCGLTGYPLSMGGPSICPSCDCGYSGPALVKAQAKELASLRASVKQAEREGMEKAARLVCIYCKGRSDTRKRKAQQGLFYHASPLGFRVAWCDADAIWSALRGSEEEGE